MSTGNETAAPAWRSAPKNAAVKRWPRLTAQRSRLIAPTRLRGTAAYGGMTKVCRTCDAKALPARLYGDDADVQQRQENAKALHKNEKSMTYDQWRLRADDVCMR